MAQNKSKNKMKKSKEGSKLSHRKTILFKAIKTSLKLIATLIGIYTTFIALYPFVSVSPYETLNPQEPLETRFVTTNQSPLPIYNVTYYSEVVEGDTKANPKIKKRVFVSLNFSSINKIEPYTEYSMRMDYRQIENAVKFNKPFIQIWVKYSLPLIPFYEFEKGFQFFALKNKDGSYIWFPNGPGKTFLRKEKLPSIND